MVFFGAHRIKPRLILYPIKEQSRGFCGDFYSLLKNIIAYTRFCFEARTRYNNPAIRT